MHGTKGTECMTCAHSGYDIDLTKVKGTECMYMYRQQFENDVIMTSNMR